MTKATRELLRKARKLTAAERGTLVRELIATFGEDEKQVELGPAWTREIARRLRDIDSGRVKPIPAAKVFAELWAAQRKNAKARRSTRRRA
jgi:putative addiction module component (TIGR02574 family)